MSPGLFLTDLNLALTKRTGDKAGCLGAPLGSGAKVWKRSGGRCPMLQETGGDQMLLGDKAEHTPQTGHRALGRTGKPPGMLPEAGG